MCRLEKEEIRRHVDALVLISGIIYQSLDLTNSRESRKNNVGAASQANHQEGGIVSQAQESWPASGRPMHMHASNILIYTGH